jgi:CHASE3 domain sensor protein
VALPRLLVDEIEHDLIKEVHPQVGAFKAGLNEMIAVVKDTSEEMIATVKENAEGVSPALPE